MSGKVDLVIKNGLVCAENAMYYGGLAIKDGIIVMQGPDSILPDAEEVYDAEGNIIFPGAIEPHYHPGQDYPATSMELFRRDMHYETRSGAQGGYTTMCATTLLNGTPMIERIDQAESSLDAGWYTDSTFYTPPYTPEHFSEIEDVVKRGYTNFKFLLGYRGDMAERLGIPRSGFDTGLMYLGFEAVKKAGGVVMVHCEDPALTEITTRWVKENYEVVHGNYLKAFSMAQPGFAEVVDICKTGYIAHELEVPLYVVHTAAKETVDQIQFFHSKGYDITCETCVPYLLLSVDDDRCYDNEYFNKMAKVGPPVHRQADQDRLWLGINEGTVSTIGTDHVAFRKEMKLDREFWDCTIGSGGLDPTSFALMISEGVNKNRASLDTIRKIMSENVAKAFNIYPRKVTLNVGSDADVVIIDLDKEYTVDHRDNESTHCGNEFDGFNLKGMPIATFLRGHLIAKDYKIVAEEAYGQPVKANTHFRSTRFYKK